MAVLSRTCLAVAVTAACYSPEVADCTVACAQPADCAPGQVCGSDGYCAAASVAGTCAKLAPPDAGVDGRAPSPDGSPPPDAPTLVRLYVRVDGRGVVTLPTIGECDGGAGQAECVFDVAKHVPVTLQATPKNQWRFDRWDDACKGSPTATCALAPSDDTAARARFEAESD